MHKYSQLLSPIELGPLAVKNRVFVPPHGTTLGQNGEVTDALIAYHEQRAKGGVGMIVLEGMTIHPTYGFEDAFLYAGNDRIIRGMKRLALACHHYDVPVIGQLFHAGRAVRLSHDGSRPVTWSASDVPDERYRVVPVPMPIDLIYEIINSYTDAAERLIEAGLDGIEILASMGYLIAQFLNPQTNRRTDEFGGSLENRMRLLTEVLKSVRQRIGPEKAIGVRITMDEKTENGLDSDTVVKICQILESTCQIDYFSVIAGSTSSPEGWLHVFPPMAMSHGYVASDAQVLKHSVNKPVLVAGRINQPQLAESILQQGQADMIGMARAMIADPEFMNKVRHNQAETIRACVGCNQACVGHRLAHYPVSCIQNPVSGRELKYGKISMSVKKGRVLVAGGGPAGMKAALTAHQRGFSVLLVEREPVLGGQVRLAEKIPGREEFGGVSASLIRELQEREIDVQTSRSFDQKLVTDWQPDHIIIATGAQSRLPEVDIDDVHMVDAWPVIDGTTRVGQNVVVADWSANWSGLGVAQVLAAAGHRVRMFSGAPIAGESLQGIVRDAWIGELYRLGVQPTPFARLYGASADTVFFQHMITGEAIEVEGVDSIVSCYAPMANNDWLTQIDRQDDRVIRVGDCLSPRTVEEAVLEGFEAAWNLTGPHGSPIFDY